jgi:hypothetical protein
MFPSGLADEVRAGIAEALEASGFLSIEGTKVTYPGEI